MTPAPTVLLLAGEPSGDHHGSALAGALKARIPGARLVGLGGPAMAAEGVDLLAGLDDLAVMGFLEVARRLPFFRRLERRVGGLLKSGEIDLVVPIDYPGFNMRVMAAAHRLRVPVLWYISPQVWAWKAGRSRTLAEQADRVAVILPFEEELLRSAGADVTFVGHPLLDRPDDVPSREEFCRSAGLDPARPVLGLFPGSRRQELERHLSAFAAAARLVAEARPDVQPILTRAPGLPGELLGGQGIPVSEQPRAVQRHSLAALVKSGTSTLETALEGTPFVMAYRTSPVTFWIARRLVRVDHVALANLVAGQRVVPEALQGEATPERLAQLLLPLLDEKSEARRVQVAGLERVRAALGSPGATDRVAAMAAELLGVAT